MATATESTEAVTIYTTAPVDYDGFSTVTIDENAGTDKYNGKVYRRVEMQPRDRDWQAQRYGSGMHAANSEADFAELVECGLVILPADSGLEPTAGDRLQAVAAAAVAIVGSVEQVNRGIWQVPHAAMQGLMQALTDAGIDF